MNGFAEESKCVDSSIIEQFINENEIYGLEEDGASPGVENRAIVPEVIQSQNNYPQPHSHFTDVAKLKTEVVQLKIQMTYLLEELERGAERVLGRSHSGVA